MRYPPGACVIFESKMATLYGRLAESCNEIFNPFTVTISYTFLWVHINRDRESYKEVYTRLKKAKNALIKYCPTSKTSKRIIVEAKKGKVLTNPTTIAGRN